ncbi:MAG: M48 family metalloprotease [Pseudomonas sp.]|uniref:M48 family metalloprotease n=1 Tax=Pseudomonas sp. TaxID=306 RepID=UPI0033930E0E
MNRTCLRGILLALLGALSACAALDSLEGVNIQGIDLGRLASAGKHVAAFREKTLDEEQLIGQDTAVLLLQQAPLLNRPAVQTYVNRVGTWLALHSERPDLAWRFAVLDNSAVGAYAAPGGYVFITRGMLAQLHNEAELAGVLAHEIAHCVRKHHLQAIQSQAQVGLLGDLTQVALQASQANSSGSTSKANQVLAKEKFEGLVGNLYSRGLDRGDEYEADAMGVVIAARAGYDPYGLASVLQGLAVSRQEDPMLVSFLKVHPNIGDRLSELEPVYLYLDQALLAHPAIPKSLEQRYLRQVSSR